jgi:hypothetical protein
MLHTNHTDLVAVSVAGAIAHPGFPGLPAEPYRLAASGKPFLLPTYGGIVYNVSIGDRAFGWAADCIHPGISIKQADDLKNRGLNVFACVGNKARVMTGRRRAPWARHRQIRALLRTGDLPLPARVAPQNGRGRPDHHPLRRDRAWC